MARKNKIVEVTDKLISMSDSLHNLNDRAKGDVSFFFIVQKLIDDFHEYDRRKNEPAGIPKKIQNMRDKERNSIITQVVDQIKVIFNQLEYEFNIAREIQKNLLPKNELNFESYNIYGVNQPCYQVGGDLFDYYLINSHRLFFGIGDVTGKGISASLLMATMKAYIRAKIEAGVPLRPLMYEANNFIFENSPPDKFITFFCGIVDCKNSSLEYINAGHNPPFLFDYNGDFSYLETGGPILGVLPKMNYNSAVFHLENINAMVAFTDGITETTNNSGKMFGEKRLLKLLKPQLNKPAKQILDSIVETVHNFCDVDVYRDDLTVLILKNISC